MLVSSIIGFVPAILLLFILLRRYEEFFRESKIFQAFAAGMVLGMVITVVESSIAITLITLAVLFPIFEESIKLVILNWPKMRGKIKTVYYGASLGVGIGSMTIIPAAFFTFTTYPETFGNPQSYFDLILLSFNFCLLNAATGVMIGYGSSKHQIFSFYIKATILHMVYSFFYFIYIVTDGNMKYGPLLIATIIAFGLFLYVLRDLLPDAVPADMMRKKRREHRKKVREERSN
jgi:hypothetical protein